MVNISKDIEKNTVYLVKEGLIAAFKNEIVPIIISTIQDDYSFMLMDIVIDKRSRVHPEQYRDEFNYRLDNFEFIKLYDMKIILIVPDVEIFDFSGQLKILHTIIEGISGIYIEVDTNEYIEIFGSIPMDDEYMDNFNVDDLYLVQYSPFIMRREKELSKKFVRCSFSNSPPLDIFKRANEMIDNDLDTWIDETISKIKFKFK